MSEPEVLCEVRNRIALVTLNRPAALNALSLTMIRGLRTSLERCAADDAVNAVLLKGSGEKAFCAGGDVRALYRSILESGTLHQEFFIEEYPLDYLLHAYPKPCLVLMDGITMGGGMGLAQGSRLRIVGERTRVAMPEVGIGLFPDVGASYWLSRLRGSLGQYLALTGAPIRGADAIHAGLADVYLGPAAIAMLSNDLDSLAWSGDPLADLRGLLERRAEDPGPAPLAALQPAIDAHFAQASVADILDSLEAETREAFVGWARETARILRTRSPTLLSVTLRQLERGRSLDLADCFRMELGMVSQCVDQGDFVEGVRAVLIDKDNAPRWRPGRLDEVTTASVEEFFRDRWTGATHPLATIEETAWTSAKQ